jgi:transposase
MRPGLPEKATHDYVRHGTTSLFAALEVATGKVTDACYDRHTHVEFLDFLKLVAKAYPRVRLHVVADNYATHKHPAVNTWLAKHPRVTMHFTPTSGSWLNMVVRHEVARDAVVHVKGGSTDVEDVAPGLVRKDRPRLGVRRG